MFSIKSPLKYFPIQIGEYKILHDEKANGFNLLEKNHNWMGYDQNSYWQSTEFYLEIENAYGVCITTGLGLGILQSNLCLKKNVSKVIVYEKSQDLIEIFYKIVEYNNFDISKLEIRQDNADIIENQICDCLFADHFDNESEEHIISVVKKLSEKNTSDVCWYWPAVNHFIKYANNQNKNLDCDTYELWKNYTGIKNLLKCSSTKMLFYLDYMQKIYTTDHVQGKLREGILSSIMRKNMLNHSKKLR